MMSRVDAIAAADAPTVAIKMIPVENIREFDRVEFACTATGNPPVEEWKYVQYLILFNNFF